VQQAHRELTTPGKLDQTPRAGTITNETTSESSDLAQLRTIAPPPRLAGFYNPTLFPQPILDAQSVDTRELLLVAGDEDEVKRRRLSCNDKVVATDRGAGQFKLCAD
jgi:hypothetical protein